MCLCLQVVFEGGCSLLKDIQRTANSRSSPAYDFALELRGDGKLDEAVNHLLETVVLHKLGYQRVIQAVLEQDR